LWVAACPNEISCLCRADGHAPGAVNVEFMFKTESGFAPNPEFLAQVRAEPALTAGTKVLVSCAAGGRSAKAVAAMVAEGLPLVIADVDKGMKMWKAEELPLE